MKKILLGLLAIFLIIEEWLWDILNVIGHTLIRWLHLQRIERWLAQCSPGTALIAFLIPLLIVTPINLAAFWMLAHGLLLQGVLVEIGAKMIGTLLVARVFALTKSQLLTYSFINWLYTTITGWLHWAHQRIIETSIYRFSKRIKNEVNTRFAAWFTH